MGSIFYLGFWRRRNRKEETILVSTTDEISVLEEARSSLMEKKISKVTPSQKKLQTKK